MFQEDRFRRVFFKTVVVTDDALQSRKNDIT